MATSYSNRYGKPIGGNRHAQGGAALNLDVGCLQGESDMITVFDDFNHVMESMAPADTDGFEECGWVVTDANTATAATLGMNDPIVAANGFDSCIRLNAGTKADSGISMQLDHINADMVSTADELTTLSGRYNFPHIWIPDATTATGLDYTTWTFACRVGFETANATGSWATGGKFFIGWAENGDTSIMTNATGVITVANDGPLVGFHIPEDGSIDGICRRTVGATAFVDGTDFTELQPTLAVNSTLANGVATIGDIVWWDLALRMDIGDNSEAVNGVTQFFTRRVFPEAAATNPGASELSLNPLGPWVRHGTVLENQTPANTAAQGALVPTIEALNGPTDACDFYVDWWSFGCSRYSRGRR